MIRKVFAAGAISVVAVGLLAAPAAAHVTIDPPSIPKGGSAQISFIVPNESATAFTNKVQLFFPGAPDAIPNVAVESLEGWHFAIRKQKLTEPVKTDDGTFDEAVSAITWVANNTSSAIGTDQYIAFSINIDGVPDNADDLVFRV